MPTPVLLVSGKDPREDLGGHASYVRAHGRALLRAGFEPHVFHVAREPRVEETEFGVVHGVGSRYFSRRAHSAPRHARPLAEAVAAHARRMRAPALVHGFSLWAYAGVRACERLRREGRATTPVASAYSVFGHEARIRLRSLRPWHGRRQRLATIVEAAWVFAAVVPFERQAYLGSRRVFVNYDSVRRLLLERYRLRGRIRVIPYASEAAFGARADAPPAPAGARGDPWVVAVSRQDVRKGVDVLLHALALLRRGGVPFRARLLGGGGLLEPHRALCARLGLADRVELPGFVPDVEPDLARAAVFVLPSLQEASGSISVLEAFQAGVPVVASAVDGIPEDVSDGDNGLLARPGDARSLADAIGRVLEESALRERLARRSRETFVRRFAPERLANALRAEYAGLGFHP